MLDSGDAQYEPGYKLGYVKDNNVYLNNHLKLLLKYHLVDEDQKHRRVVGCEVEAFSVSLGDYQMTNPAEDKCTVSTKKNPLQVNEKGNNLGFLHDIIHLQVGCNICM